MAKATTRPRAQGASRKSEIPEVVRAHEFILVDRNGTERAQIGFVDDEQNMAQVALAGPDGRPTVAVTADADGPSIGFVDENGLRMFLALGPGTDGEMVMQLSNTDGACQFGVRVPHEGSVELEGWPGWANERLEVTWPALRLLAAEVRGFLDGEHATQKQLAELDGDPTMAKLVGHLHETGAAERQRLEERLQALEARERALVSVVERIAGAGALLSTIPPLDESEPRAHK